MGARTACLVYLLIGLTLPGLPQQAAGDPYLVWTQKTHMWARLRGIMGQPSQWVTAADRTFVGSIPDRNRTYYALTHDPVANYVYWHDREQFAFYRQPVMECLQERTTEGLELVYRGQSAFITGIAVDWNTQAMYFVDDYYNLVGVCGSGTGLARDVHQVLFSTSIDRPVGIVVQPDQGLLYWLDAGNQRLERATLYGTSRNTLLQGPDVGNAANLAIDHQDNALYWSIPGVGVKRIVLYTNTVENVVTFGDTTILGLAVYQDYLFLGDSASYAINIYQKTGIYIGRYIIDADPHQLSILAETRPPTSDCSLLQCEHLCIRGDDGVNMCVCGYGYQLEVDGRSCASSKVSPIYIYSRGSSVWMDYTTIYPNAPHHIIINETLVSRDKIRVQPIGFHYDRNLVYFGDTYEDVLYRIMPGAGAEYELEITVNTRQAEGISVDWLTDTVYWSDFDLKHIMCSQLDGRFHRIVLENLDGPRGLSVDPSHGVMFWANDGTTKGIMRAKLDGSGVSTLTTQNIIQPQGLTADARQGRLYWTDRNRNQINTMNYDGTGRRIVLENSQTLMYDVTIFKDYVTYTEGNSPLKFAFEKTGDRINSLDTSVSNDAASLGIALDTSYDVVAYDSYLQPQATNLCGTDNGGCEHLCVLVSPTPQPSTATSAKCQCAIGFHLSDDDRNCYSNMQNGNFVLFVDPYHKQVYELGLDGQQEVHGITLPRQDFPISVDVDPINGRIYWIDRKKQEIRSSSFFGHDPKTLWSYGNDASPERLAVDTVNEHIYVTDSWRRRVIRLPLNGRDIRDSDIYTVADSLWSPYALALDINNEILYWTDRGARTVNKMNFDGSARDTLYNNINFPSGITVSSNGNPNYTMVYWSDQTVGQIFSYNPDDGQISPVFQDTSLEINSLSSDGVFIYFSAWNEKAVYRWEVGTAPVATVLGQPIFARIYDIHVYTGIVMPPVPVSTVPVTLYAGLGVLAFVLLALLIGLIAFMAVRKKPPAPKATSAGEDNHVYMNDEAGITAFTNPQAFDTVENGVPMTNGHAETNGHAHAETNGHAHAETNGHAEANGHAETNGLDRGSSMGGVPAVGVIPLAAGAAARKVKLRRGRELPAPPTDASFVLSGNAQATVIQRLANRLRNRLSSVRFSKSPRNSGENWQRETDIDDEPGGEIPPQQTTPVTKGHIRVEPQLHRPPRGYAPASRCAPQPVKTTWSKAKSALALKKY